jgi:Mycothiol maleylpyruvate isomerase N-terminal domain
MTDPRRARTLDTLELIYGQVSGVVEAFDEATFGQPSGCQGWDRQAMLVHMLSDARRALVTFATPGSGRPDVDAVTYWRDYAPTTGDGGAAQGKFVHRLSTAYTEPQWVRSMWLETAPAAVRAGRGCREDLVATQGHVLTVADFVETLVFEATVHYLDLTIGLDVESPSRAALEMTVNTLDGLLEGRPPTSWGLAEYVVKATGRLPLTTEDQQRLGELASRFPVLA